MSVEIPDELMRDEAYDEAMDSLTQSERNRLLRSVARPTQPSEEGPEKAPRTPIIKTALLLTIEVTGAAIEAIGRVLLWAGTKMRAWAYRERVG